MVERTPGLIRATGGEPLEAPRRRPPRGHRPASRRVVAALLLVGGLAALAVVLVLVLGRKSPAPAPAPAPAPPPLRILFPEGFTRAKMAARIAAVDAIARRERGIRPLLSSTRYLALTAHEAPPPCFPQAGGRRTLEGFLFPATYDFDATTTTAQLVQDQLQAFCDHWSTLDLRYPRRHGLTAYGVLEIASMIEGEVAAPEERRLVAAVIYNRLAQGMPLGIDATIRYGLRIPASAPLTVSELANPTPYNSRLHKGLPPTPIANPGYAALYAAAHPAAVNYLYYVRKPDGLHHFFTASYSAFRTYALAHGYR